MYLPRSAVGADLICQDVNIGEMLSKYNWFLMFKLIPVFIIMGNHDT